MGHCCRPPSPNHLPTPMFKIFKDFQQSYRTVDYDSESDYHKFILSIVKVWTAGYDDTIRCEEFPEVTNFTVEQIANETFR